MNNVRYLPSTLSFTLASSRILLRFSVNAIDVGGRSAAVSTSSVARASPNAVVNNAEWARTSAPRLESNVAASKQVPFEGSPPTPPHTIVKGVSPTLFSRST